MAEPVTNRRILKIAVPLVISNVSVPLLGIVDTGVIGQLGLAAPIGAVGLGAVILSSLYWVFGFLRMGTVGLTGQALGANDQAEVGALFFRATLIGAAAGIGLILLQLPLFAAAFWLSPATAEVEGLTRTYMQVRIWSAPAAIALYGITGWLIAQERTRAVFAIQLWTNGFNIGLDILFVLHFGWGIGGIAFATFLAEWSGLALGLWLCRDVFANPAHRAWALIVDRAKLIRMAKLNTDILIRSAFLMMGFTSFLFLGSDFGDVTLAANQVLLQFVHITAYAMDGFAFAAEALVGQAIGAKAVKDLRRSTLMTSAWGAANCIILALVFALFGPNIIDLLTTAESVRAEARIYLWWMVLAPMVAWPSWMFDGIFIGATRSKDMRNMMIVSFIIYVTALAATLNNWGNDGLWFALVVFFVARGVTLGSRYPTLERSVQA